MTPLFFGSAQRRLFGAYEPPRAARAGARAVVLCYPWGQEYIRAHRSMRQLANMLCAAGYHVLRFDYFGTGDSAGEFPEASLRGWEQDIETAMEELRDTSGATRIGLIGLRLGATLATHVAVRKKKAIDALVLWDPVVSGPEYLEEMLGTTADHKDAAERVSPDFAAAGSGREVRGFPLTDAFADEIRAIDLSKLVPTLPARTRLIASAPLPSHDTLRAELERHARADVVMEHIDGLLAWLEYRDYGAGAVPRKVLEAIVQWVR